MGPESGAILLASEVIHRDWIFEQRIIPRHHSDSAVGDEVALPVGLGIVTDSRPFGDMHVAIDDGLADTAMAAHVHMRKQNAVVDFAVGIDAHIGGEHAVFYRTSGNDAACG